MKSEPLTDAEFERLSGILGRFDNKQPMNLEQLDGFLAALICGPEIVRPSEYLPVIFGSGMVLEDSFGSQSVLQDFLSLIMRHRRPTVEPYRRNRQRGADRQKKSPGALGGPT